MVYASNAACSNAASMIVESAASMSPSGSTAAEHSCGHLWRAEDVAGSLELAFQDVGMPCLVIRFVDVGDV